MVYLKKIGNLWSDILTFGWLDRLSVKHPRLAGAITGFLFSVGFSLCAWYFLDPRFVIYEKTQYVPMNWTLRIVYGILFGLASLIAVYVIIVVRNDSIWETEMPFLPQLLGRRKKRRL